MLQSFGDFFLAAFKRLIGAWGAVRQWREQARQGQGLGYRDTKQ